jgi:hypothetical protein
MKKYAHGQSYKATFAQQGFSNVMTMYAAAKQVKKLSPYSLNQFLFNVKHLKVFMGPNMVPSSLAPLCQPAIRQPLERIVQWKGGKLKNVTKGYVGFGSPC